MLFIRRIPNTHTIIRLAAIFLFSVWQAILFTGTDALAASSPADPDKVLHIPFEAADDGFDMVKNANLYSGWVSESIFETLLTYDYLARPAKLVPLTAEAMPTISNNGQTLVFHIKKGIYFTPDPVFRGKPRELTAQDYAYSIKRFLDPANRSPSIIFVDGKITGMDQLVANAKKTGKFDYDAPVAGLTTPDRYTLRIELTHTDYNFLYCLTYSSFGAVAREVVEAYPEQLASHPVGTGPYMLKKYIPRSKIILVANPDYRGFIWDFHSSGSAWDDQVVREMQGKKMPQIGKIDISIIEEEQARWLSFQNKQLDIDWLPQIATPSALDGDKLKPMMRDKGIKLFRAITPDITYTIFNFRDPVVGGFSLKKNALRRAIIMSYNIDDDIIQLRMGQAIRSEMMVPPGMAGHDPDYRSSIGYNIPLANQLLDRFGYKRGADGYRTLPNGQALLLKFASTASASAKTGSEIWKRGLDKIGLRAVFLVNNFADNVKAANECQLMIFGSAWQADFPDGENFLQLLYGPNALHGNNGCYQSPAYDALYKKAVNLPLGPERNALYVQMNRQMEADSAWSLETTRIRNWVMQADIMGFTKHPILNSLFKYMDIRKDVNQHNQQTDPPASHHASQPAQPVQPVQPVHQ